MIFLWCFQAGWEHLLTEFPSGVDVQKQNQVIEIVLENQVTMPLMLWPDPPISGPKYELSFEIKGELNGQAYLEMWSIFEDGSRYFTRTMAESGPMSFVEGSFGWRKISLPFDTQGKVSSPIQLEINLISDRGTLWLRNVDLQSSGSASFFPKKFLVLGFCVVFILGLTIGGILIYLQKQKNHRRMKSLDL